MINMFNDDDDDDFNFDELSDEELKELEKQRRAEE